MPHNPHDMETVKVEVAPMYANPYDRDTVRVEMSQVEIDLAFDDDFMTLDEVGV